MGKKLKQSLFFLMLSSQTLFATDWNGVTSSMNLNTNWSPQTTPTSPASLVFPLLGVTGGVYSPIMDIAGAPLQISSIQFTSSSSSYTISQGSNTFVMNPGITITSVGANTIAVNSQLAGLLNISSSSNPLTFSGVLSEASLGAGSLSLATGGLLVLSGSNTYHGSTTIANGATISVTTQAALENTSSIINGGVLIFNTSGSGTPFAPTITSSGSVQMTGSGTVSIAPATVNTYTGGTFITAGTWGISNTGNVGTGSVSLGPGTLLLQAVSTYSFPLILTSGGTVSLGTTNATISGTISEQTPGAGVLNVAAGTGTISLSGANTYSGGTVIKNGTVSIGAQNNLGTGPVTMGSTTVSALSISAPINNLSNAITLQGTASIASNGNALTITSPISGAGLLKILPGGGTVTFSSKNGAYSYSGGTEVVNPGTLVGDTSSLQGTITIDPGSILQFNQTFSGTYAGALNSSGALQIEGGGTVTVSGTSSGFTGTTTIGSGVLNVTGSLLNSPISVGSNGTLAGGGTVGAVTNTGGTIGPNDISTLHINGTLGISGPADYVVNINASGESDTVSVSSNATLAGDVVVEALSGFYGFGTDYTILTAGSISGGFNPVVVSNDPNFIFTMSQNANNVFLNLRVLAPFLDFPFSNKNTKAVGNNINRLGEMGLLASNAGLVSAIDSLSGLSNSAVNNALDQMHPALFSAYGEVQAEVGGQLLAMFHRRPGPVCCSKELRVWVEPYGNWLTEKHTGIQVGFDADSLGLAAGMDWEIKDNVVIGIGGVANHSDLKWDHHRGHSNINGYYGGVYVDYTRDSIYLGASVLGGIDHFHAFRHMQFSTVDETAVSEHNAIDVMAQIATGIFFGPEKCCFWPYFNADYMYLNQEAYNEDNAPGLNLRIESNYQQTVRTELGIGFQVIDKNYNETMCVSPKLNIAWVVEHPITRQRYSTAFEGEPVQFGVYGWDKTWSLFAFTFGLDFSYKCFTLGGEYAGEFSGSNHLWDQRANVRLSLNW